MRLIKGSLAGLVLVGILAMMPAAAFAHGGYYDYPGYAYYGYYPSYYTATAGEATIGLGGIAIMAGGAGTGGTADTAGTAADGTVIIDSCSATVPGVLRHSAVAVLC